jgi:hypothetical protein
MLKTATWNELDGLYQLWSNKDQFKSNQEPNIIFGNQNRSPRFIIIMFPKVVRTNHISTIKFMNNTLEIISNDGRKPG